LRQRAAKVARIRPSTTRGFTMSKFLTESGWKTVSQKTSIADNGLKKALADYEKLGDDKHAEKLKALASVMTLAGKMKTLLSDGIKTAKDNKAKPEVSKNLADAVKYLAEVEKAVDAERKQLEAALKKAEAVANASEPPMLDRLVNAAAMISGSQGSRLKKVMAIAKSKGGSWKTLWYYNNHAVFQFVKYDAKASTREALIKAGGGKLPFKGDTWVVFPFGKKLGMHCPPGCPDRNLVNFLKSVDDDIVNSIAPLAEAQATEAGTIFGPSVDAFMKHVGSLAKDSSHLYSAGY
jgi:hypothetical protein